MTTPRIAKEVIDFQNDDFGLKLEALFEEMNSLFKDKPDLTGKDLDKSGFGDRFSKLIFDRTGISTKIVFDTNTPGTVFLFPINRNHVLLKDFFRDAYYIPGESALTKKFEDKSGTIDLKKAKMSGIFSEYKHTVLFGYIGLIKHLKVTPREATAILLHELGHAFTYYEFSDQLEQTNQVLFDLSNAIKDDNKKKRVYLFKELSKKMGQKPDFFDDILEEDNRVIISSKIFKTYIQSVKSQLSHPKYNETSSEQLADNFAARFGYGRDLVEILDRLYEYSPEKNTTVYFMARFSEVIFFLWIGIRPLIILSFGLNIGFLFFSVAIATLLIYINGEDIKDMTYDDILIRYRRVRHQYIEQIKNLNIPKEQLKDIIDAVHVVDEIMRKTIRYESLISSAANFVFSRHKTAKENVRLQQLLEEIAHNDLFLKSAELKTLA